MRYILYTTIRPYTALYSPINTVLVPLTSKKHLWIKFTMKANR